MNEYHQLGDKTIKAVFITEQKNLNIDSLVQSADLFAPIHYELYYYIYGRIPKDFQRPNQLVPVYCSLKGDFDLSIEIKLADELVCIEERE